MNRRKAIQVTGLLLGGAFVSTGLLLQGCGNEDSQPFNKADIALLDEIGDTIIPSTADSPGAKAAQIGAFMKTIVTDCYTRQQQENFLGGLKKFRDKVKQETQRDFIQLSKAEREKFLSALDLEAVAFDKQKKTEEPVHYYSMIKSLTVWGYFTSEPGATKALHYVMIPGRYDGDIPYRTGDKAYAL